MPKKIKIGSVEFIKTVGHDTKLNVNFRTLSTELKNGNIAEFKSLNSTIYLSEKPVRVIVTIYDKDSKSIGQLLLSKSQTPNIYLDLVDEFNKDPQALN